MTSPGEACEAISHTHSTLVLLIVRIIVAVVEVKLHLGTSLPIFNIAVALVGRFVAVAVAVVSTTLLTTVIIRVSMNIVGRIGRRDDAKRHGRRGT